MNEPHEMIVIEMATEARLRLSNQVAAAMEKKGYTPYDWPALDLGFELPAGWPADINAQPTMAQLIVIARKLEVRIVIGDLNLTPLREGSDDGGKQ